MDTRGNMPIEVRLVEALRIHHDETPQWQGTCSNCPCESIGDRSRANQHSLRGLDLLGRALR